MLGCITRVAVAMESEPATGNLSWADFARCINKHIR